MTDLQPRRQALPVMLLVKTSLQFLWQQRDDALRLGLVPTLLLFGSLLYGADGVVALAQTAQLAQSGAPAEVPPEAMPRLLALSVGLYVAVAWLTVNWLRFLLLGPMGAVGLGLKVRKQRHQRN